ncbi:unnamed protein product, partial [Brenthis ino]
MSWKCVFLFSILFGNAMSQFYEDKRCRCICPTISIVNDTHKTLRTLYIAYVPPNLCNCNGVILPKVADEVRHNARMFCPRCECKYESRNTTIIMIVVIFVIWVVMLLMGYYIFLMLLELLVTKRPNYTEVSNRTDETENLLVEYDEAEDY